MPHKEANSPRDTALTTLTRFQLSGAAERWWAFGQMPQAEKALAGTPGMLFGRLLGSGGGEGFAPWPDWGIYFLLQTWENAAAAEQFHHSHFYRQEWNKHSPDATTLWLKAYRSVGAWGGQNPFGEQKEAAPAAYTVVLTRARIRSRRLLSFWRHVPEVSRRMAQQPGLCYYKGIGKWPLIEQATVSVWESEAALKAFAYQGARHAEVIRKTRQRNWYSEELFARFALLKQIGPGLI